MSIASEITSMGENLKKDYQSIANLGADLTNVDKNIENIAELLDGVYDNLPKTEYQEGTEITLSNTLKGKLDFDDGKVGFGQTEQDGTPTPSTPITINSVTGNQDVVVSGINEINVEYPTTTAYGVTCTNNGNGTYTFNGTAEKDLYFDMAYFTLPAGTQKLVGCPSGGSWNSYIQYIRRVDGQAFSINDMGSGGSTEVTGNEGQLRLSILIKSGYTCNNLLFKPMVTDNTSLTYNDYEPYITPQTYQLSLGEYKFYGIGTYRDYILRTTGRNKCNITSATGWLYSSGLPGHEDTSIVVDSFESNKITYHSNTNSYLEVLTNNIQLKPNTKYTITFKRTSTATNNQFFIYDYTQENGYAINYRDNNTNVYEVTFTTSNNGIVVLGFGFGNATGSATVSNIMLEEGSTASDYQPYGVGNWYKVGKIGEYQFTGQEEWTQSGYTTNDYLCCFCIVGIDIGGATELVTDILSNRFKAGSYTQSFGNLISSSNNPNGFNLCIDKNIASDVTALQTYFANNPTYALYIHKKNTTYTPITGTLAEQLEAWYNAHSFTGTTIITSNGNLPMIIKCRGLKGE